MAILWQHTSQHVATRNMLFRHMCSIAHVHEAELLEENSLSSFKKREMDPSSVFLIQNRHSGHLGVVFDSSSDLFHMLP